MADKSPSYLIGKAATLSGVTAANIRFYERQGLLRPGERSSNTYRSYSDSEVHQLRFIRLCRTMDMSLEEVRTLLNLDLRSMTDCATANATLAAHIVHVQERLVELRALRRDLIDLRGRCDGSGPRCKIMEALHIRAAVMPEVKAAARGHRHV
ncbi:MAG: MerR family transcriptional regulator [Burkholderiaceae bacterium]